MAKAAKKEPKKPPKKYKGKYYTKLKVNASADELLQVLINPSNPFKKK